MRLLEEAAVTEQESNRAYGALLRGLRSGEVAGILESMEAGNEGPLEDLAQPSGNAYGALLRGLRSGEVASILEDMRLLEEAAVTEQESNRAYGALLRGLRSGEVAGILESMEAG